MELDPTFGTNSNHYLVHLPPEEAAEYLKRSKLATKPEEEKLFLYLDHFLSDLFETSPSDAVTLLLSLLPQFADSKLQEHMSRTIITFIQRKIKEKNILPANIEPFQPEYNFWRSIERTQLKRYLEAFQVRIEEDE